MSLGRSSRSFEVGELLLLLDVRLPVSHHVVAVAEALLAQVADERPVAVLERRPRAGKRRRPVSDDAAAADGSDATRHDGHAPPAISGASS